MSEKGVSLSPTQIQKKYGIKPPTIRSWYRQGKIKGGKIGRLILIDAKDFKKRYFRLVNGGEFFDE